MRKVALVFALGFVAAACSDQLARMQEACTGTWILESRRLTDGTTISPPNITGTFDWKPIDARKAHVTVTLMRQKEGGQMFDHAASTYEISTSAITRKRYILIQRGYRDREGSPFSDYVRAKTEKGKATMEKGKVVFFHAAKEIEEGKPLPPDTGLHQVFERGRMTLSYTGEFTDTYRRVN